MQAVIKDPNKADNPNQYMIGLFMNNNKAKLTDEEIQAKTVKKFGKKNTVAVQRISNVARIRRRLNNGRIGSVGDLDKPIKQYFMDGKKRTTKKPADDAKPAKKTKKKADKKKPAKKKAAKKPAKKAKKKPARKKPARKKK
jgi:hypothetical protein